MKHQVKAKEIDNPVDADDRAGILNDFLEATAKLVIAGVRDLRDDAQGGLADILDDDRADIRVAVRLEPVLVIVYAHWADGRAPVELFRVGPEYMRH